MRVGLSRSERTFGPLDLSPVSNDGPSASGPVAHYTIVQVSLPFNNLSKSPFPLLLITSSTCRFSISS